MARPTDPAKLAAYLARQARNSANYRARQRAAATGMQVPVEAQRQRPANYRPPRVSGVVERAKAVSTQQRAARAAVISSLPDVRNPAVRLRVGEQTERMWPERKTRAGRQRQAEAIRERAAAERLQTIGRARQRQIRDELRNGPQADRLQENMTKSQQREFQHLSEIIVAGSQQSVGIHLEYAGGLNEYYSALERILASPESRDVEEGLGILEALAEKAQRAARLYAPNAIGRLTV